MEKSNFNPKNRKKEKAARIGIGTKGIVYVLIGGLTAWGAYGSGGKSTGSGGVMTFLENQPFGNVLLWLMAIGLTGYVFWRMYQTFSDPENKGHDAKGLVARIGYFISGIFYIFLVYTAIDLATGSSGGGGGGQQSMIQELLSQEFGRWLVALVALAFLGKAVYQMYRAYSGKFKEKLQEFGMDEKKQKLMVNSGRVGYTARGFVIGIVAYLTVRAAITYDASKAGGTKDAFNFIQNEFGVIVLGIIALGLMAYGVFLVIKADNRKMNFS